MFIYFEDNAGVIVNPKGEMKGKLHCIYVKQGRKLGAGPGHAAAEKGACSCCMLPAGECTYVAELEHLHCARICELTGVCPVQDQPSLDQ